jgi:hypothetical protein
MNVDFADVNEMENGANELNEAKVETLTFIYTNDWNAECLPRFFFGDAD